MKKEEDKNPRREANSYLKYSGLGLQLLLTILVSGWVGYKVDRYLSIKFPVFMILFGFAAFAGSIYQLYRKLNKE